MSTRLALPDERSTARLGEALARAIEAHRAAIERDGLVLGLSGDLGAGKTTLVRALLRALGVTGSVKSPTFALLEPYVVSSLNFYHFDFYRFEDPSEFDAAGFRELFGPGAVAAVEWPERAAGRLPTADLSITLRVRDDGREVDLAAAKQVGLACLQHVTDAWAARPAPRAAAS